MKLCPFLAIARHDPSRSVYQEFSCIESKCAFWVDTLVGKDCAVVFLADIAFRIAAARFPAAVNLKFKQPR